MPDAANIVLLVLAALAVIAWWRHLKAQEARDKAEAARDARSWAEFRKDSER